jgi:metal-responsive CopG/Arc/MetJ family transcriptional regulator
MNNKQLFRDRISFTCDEDLLSELNEHRLVLKKSRSLIIREALTRYFSEPIKK